MEEKQKVEMPKFLAQVKEEKNKKILGAFYDAFHRRDWFHRAELYEKTVLSERPIIELYAHFRPTFEMSDLYMFTNRYNIAFEVKVLENL